MYLIIEKKTNSENTFINPQSMSFERRICAQDLHIFKNFNMSQINPKEVVRNIAYSFNYRT